MKHALLLLLLASPAAAQNLDLRVNLSRCTEIPNDGWQCPAEELPWELHQISAEPVRLRVYPDATYQFACTIHVRYPTTQVSTSTEDRTLAQLFGPPSMKAQGFRLWETREQKMSLMDVPSRGIMMLNVTNKRCT